MMSLFSFRGRRFAAKETETERAKQKMQHSAANAEQKKEELKDLLERNGITLHIFRSVGGKHDGN